MEIPTLYFFYTNLVSPALFPVSPTCSSPLGIGQPTFHGYVTRCQIHLHINTLSVQSNESCIQFAKIAVQRVYPESHPN